jgi:hypothetical protein
MSDNNEKTSDHPLQPGDLPGSAHLSRRRLVGVGLGVSAIFTLASRPVLANNCATPSAAASGNMSHHGTPPTCAGRTTIRWAGTNKNQLPGGDSKFKDIFKNGTKATWGSNDKLANVLSAPDNANTGLNPNPISKEFVAALLNIRAGYIPSAVMDQARLVDMWNDWVSDGIFNPHAGVDWTATQIVTYLQGLQI